MEEKKQEVNSEDSLADVKFDDDVEEETKEQSAFDVKKEPQIAHGFELEFDANEDEEENREGEPEKTRMFLKKNGNILMIKYNFLGKKENVRELNKNKVLIRAKDYYENGQLKIVTNYGIAPSYKSMMYNVDGSRASFVEKFQDGTSHAIYFDGDNKGGGMEVWMDKNKNVTEKKFLK